MSYTRLSPLKPGQEAAFARLLQAKMDETGVTLDDISEATGVVKTTVYRWLHGHSRPGGTRIVAMAELLGCEPEALIPGMMPHVPDTPDWLEAEREASRQRMRERREGKRPGIGQPSAPYTHTRQFFHGRVA